MKNLHNCLHNTLQHVHLLEVKIHSLIEAQSVSLQEEDANDVNAVIKAVQPLVEEQFPANTPQRIFWDQQVQFNNLKSKRQMRWQPLVIRFALNLKYMSMSAYKAVRQSGIINSSVLIYVG